MVRRSRGSSPEAGMLLVTMVSEFWPMSIVLKIVKIVGSPSG